jgi:hypothetical protein
MDDSKDTFATNPLPLTIPDPGVMKDGRFVHPNTPAMDLLSYRDFIWMKVFEA